MRRLYFLIPNIDSAKTIVDELLLARIEERHIHIAAADHHALVEAHLPEASLLQESDFVPAVERGLAIGGATGILAGIAAVTIPGAALAQTEYPAGSARLYVHELSILDTQPDLAGSALR
jgi:hypothetical protein